MKYKMRKKVIKILVAAGSLFLCFSCATNKIINGKEGLDPTNDNGQIQEDQPAWKKIESLEEMTGLWRAENGCEYEWPFVLNGEKYLRLSFTEKDVTSAFADYAKKHNMEFDYLWAHKFAYLGRIRLLELDDGRKVPSPYSYDNGVQIGYKFREDYTKAYNNNIRFRVFIHEEILVPERIARNNVSFFMMMGNDSLKEDGKFDFEGFSRDSAGQVYKKTENYWTK